jgi:excisionase family DNA binding protein
MARTDNKARAEGAKQPGGSKPRRETTSVEMAAHKLGIGRNQAYAAVQRGEIPGIRVGRRWLVPNAALDRLLSGSAALEAE